MSSANSTVSDVSAAPSGESEQPEAAGDTTGVIEATEETQQQSDEAEVSLPVDVIFEVLKNQRRRRVIQYLRSAEGPVELGSVAEHIAALENDKEEAAITYAERKRVYVGLYQCHLPKMDDMGVVDFNRARGRIELTDQAMQLTPYLEGPVTRRPWHRYYGGMVVAGVGLLAATLVTPVSPYLALFVLLAGLTVCTLSHRSEQT